MRAAIVHYWLLNHRGGEKVLDAICRILPEADIFTLFCDPEMLSPTLRRHKIVTSFLNPLRRGYRSLLPLMPLALESFDLRGYDLVVSSESGPAKGVMTPASARHLCYCHTPMRYLWDLYPAYRADFTASRWKRAAMVPLTNYLRLWDFASAARVDHFVANSQNVRRRIWKTYRRAAEVIHPPVDVESFYWKPPEDYFLIVSELVPYKRVDLAVRLFSRTGRRLVIAGSGPEYRTLRKIAAGNVEFLGRASDSDLRELYARCRAFLLPGEEDFGITPVEALASGKPVIALARGGALETVPPFGGVFFDAPSEDHLSAAIAAFENLERDISPADLQAHVRGFSEAGFTRKFTAALARVIESDGPVPHTHSENVLEDGL
ncbi:Glycosyl transferase, group 1 [Candidatus Sulfopaludibacter sp. SbA4]|nr:Glycosyl transferase, group 1 [Candidatus Sulfopaludibacter sp. SbA4]